MGNKINIPENDEFFINYKQFIIKETELKNKIDELYRLADNLRLESYNEKYDKIKIIDNEIKFLYSQMEKKAVDRNNPKLEEIKRKKLIEVKKKYLSLLEDYMKIPVKIFSTIKLEIK